MNIAAKVAALPFVLVLVALLWMCGDEVDEGERWED